MGGFRFGVFAQLITSFILAVIFTVAAAGVGIFSIQKFNKGIEEVALSRLPAMTLAYQLGQQSEAIVASAPMLVRVNTQAQRETISFRIADRVRWLQEIVDSLRSYEVDENVLEVIDVTRQQLLENYARLDQLVQDRIEINQHKIKQNAELQKLIKVRGRYDTPVAIEWNAVFNDLIELFLIFETEKDQNKLDKYRKILMKELNGLQSFDQENISKNDSFVIKQLRKIALGENGLIALQARQKLVEQRIAGILSVNERLSSRFVYSVNDLIRRMREEIEEDSMGFQQLVESRTNILTFIVVGSVLALGLIGGIYIRRIFKTVKCVKAIHADPCRGW